jgi:hypothetical protein
MIFSASAMVAAFTSGPAGGAAPKVGGDPSGNWFEVAAVFSAGFCPPALQPAAAAPATRAAERLRKSRRELGMGIPFLLVDSMKNGHFSTLGGSTLSKLSTMNTRYPEYRCRFRNV